MTINLEAAGFISEPYISDYTWKDTALYAMGLGATTRDLKYLLDSPPPQVLPTYGVIPAFKPVTELIKETGGDLVNLLHTAQSTTLLSPFPAEGQMSTTAKINGIWDMKIGALAEVSTLTYVNEKETSKTLWHLLLRGEGGFGGERPPAFPKTRAPRDKDPCFCDEIKTHHEQALLYRLTGDTNPIHSHPEVAKKAGFENPILHGLCTYGIAAKAALKNLAGDEPSNFVSFDVRFSKIVMPGETLVIEGWILEDGKAAVNVTTKENKTKAIMGAVFKYKS